MFDEKEKKVLELDKTLISVILFFMVSILGAWAITALADWHNYMWLWGVP